jgi:Flp pilus assembly protein TadG
MTYAFDIISMGTAALLLLVVIAYDLGHFFGYRKGVRDTGEALNELLLRERSDDANV